jgi:aldehyde:ferredoxin oxidoreductase
MKGYFGQILVVDLTNEKSYAETLPYAVYEEYIGGKGLGSYLLLKNNPAGADPLGPENNLIFTLGPINDTRIWGSSRYGVVTKSPLTGLFAESYSGGRVAEPMSRTGYDAFVIRGASKKPVFLDISDKEVMFRDASAIWGTDAYEAETRIKEQIAVKDAGIVVIGPAGENLVKFAAVINDKWRCAGRTGIGAVMGSKKLKGIAFHGTKKREVADLEGVEDFRRFTFNAGKNGPSVNAFRKFGTPGLVSMVNAVEAFPSRYWSQGTMDGWQAINAETLHSKLSVKPRACNRCFIACGRFTKVLEGRHAGLTIDGPEYETIYAFGGLCLIKDLREIVYLNDLCDRLGIDTITAGNLAAFAIEASQRGRISEKLEYGDAEAVASILTQISGKKGLGAVLAEGIVSAANEWDLDDIAIHVKGLEPAGYDPRYFKGMALAYATSDRGACHIRTTAFRPELAGIIPPDRIEGKAEIVVEYEDRLTLHDTLVVCRFYRDLYLWDELSKIVLLTTGRNMEKEELTRIASNVRTAARVFNIREGMTGGADTLPRRFFEEPLGSKKVVVSRDQLERLKQDYYRLRGWNRKGEPVSPLPLIEA